MTREFMASAISLMAAAVVAATIFINRLPGRSYMTTQIKHVLEFTLTAEEVELMMRGLTGQVMMPTTQKKLNELYSRLHDYAYQGFGRTRPWTVKFEV